MLEKYINILYNNSIQTKFSREIMKNRKEIYFIKIMPEKKKYT